MQKQFGVSSTQLLFASSPFMAATLGLIAVPLDSALVGGTPFDFDYTTAVTCVAILSCLIAIAVNFSTFLVIGRGFSIHTTMTRLNFSVLPFTANIIISACFVSLGHALVC